MTDTQSIEKAKLAIRRRNSDDVNIHPSGQPHEFYAVSVKGELLFIYEHDTNSGKTALQGVKDVFKAQQPEMFEEGIKPDLEKIELVKEG